jgi:hypothetical protein
MAMLKLPCAAPGVTDLPLSHAEEKLIPHRWRDIEPRWNMWMAASLICGAKPH